MAKTASFVAVAWGVSLAAGYKRYPPAGAGVRGFDPRRTGICTNSKVTSQASYSIEYEKSQLVKKL